MHPELVGWFVAAFLSQMHRQLRYGAVAELKRTYPIREAIP